MRVSSFVTWATARLSSCSERCCCFVSSSARAALLDRLDLHLAARGSRRLELLELLLLLHQRPIGLLQRRLEGRGVRSEVDRDRHGRYGVGNGELRPL